MGRLLLPPSKRYLRPLPPPVFFVIMVTVTPLLHFIFISPTPTQRPPIGLVKVPTSYAGPSQEQSLTFGRHSIYTRTRLRTFLGTIPVPRAHAHDS